MLLLRRLLFLLQKTWRVRHVMRSSFSTMSSSKLQLASLLSDWFRRPLRSLRFSQPHRTLRDETATFDSRPDFYNQFIRRFVCRRVFWFRQPTRRRRAWSSWASLNYLNHHHVCFCLINFAYNIFFILYLFANAQKLNARKNSGEKNIAAI